MIRWYEMNNLLPKKYVCKLLAFDDFRALVFTNL